MPHWLLLDVGLRLRQISALQVAVTEHRSAPAARCLASQAAALTAAPRSKCPSQSLLSYFLGELPQSICIEALNSTAFTLDRRTAAGVFGAGKKA